MLYNGVGTQWEKTTGGPLYEISIDSNLLMFL